MIIEWTLDSNAKSERNAVVLFNQLKRHLSGELSVLLIEGDRYCGQQICFTQRLLNNRADALLTLLQDSERLANSWTLTQISPQAAACSTRSRIAGLRCLSWRERCDTDE